MIIDAYNEISEEMCHRVVKNLEVRVEEIARGNAGLIKHEIR